MNNEIIWSLIIGSLSVGLGWILNEISQFFRNRGEKKRIINNVIFNLLNIRFELNKLNQVGISSVIINKMHETLGDPLPEQDVIQITNIINLESKEILEFNLYENLETISEQFDDVLQEFAKIDPIGAYRLWDKAKVFKIIDDLEDYLRAIQKKYGNALTDEIFDKLGKHLKEIVFVESLNSIEEEIIALSFKTKGKNRKLILKKLKEQNSISSIDNELNQLVNIVKSGIK